MANTSSETGVDFKQLRTSVEWSIKKFSVPRKNRIDAIKQYVGNHYAEGGSDKVVPTNFLEMATTIYMHQLVARAPRCTFTTKVPRLKPFAYTTELALNQIPDEINLHTTLQNAVMEALFSFGVVKVGIAQTGKKYNEINVGEPFADLVSIDDYFCDMAAKSRNDIQYEGNDYWMPVEDARSLWGNDVKSDPHTITGDAGEERAESITSDEGAELYKEKVWVRDVWLPRYGKMLTYGIKTGELFRVVEWDGPACGPYHMLGFSSVPGNILPLPPIALWSDLHNLANMIFRKLGRQADAKKRVFAFQGGNDDDVNRLIAANDGEGIKYSGAKPEVLDLGGIDQTALAFWLQIRSTFSYMAGNLDALGGLAPMSETIGQDEMMKQSASARVEKMRQKTLDFAREIFKSLAWYEWTDPLRERMVEKPVKGVDITVRSKWSTETIDADWLDFNFDIDAYSMESDTPASKLQKIGHVLERYVFPGIPLLQQQGGQINYKELMALVAKLGNVPELNDIIQFGEPQQTPPEQGNAQPTMGMPSNTKRVYERTNRPGATRQGQDDVMSRLLMGSKVQDAEASSLMRGVS